MSQHVGRIPLADLGGWSIRSLTKSSAVLIAEAYKCLSNMVLAIDVQHYHAFESSTRSRCLRSLRHGHHYHAQLNFKHVL